jgi:glutaredoxin 2
VDIVKDSPDALEKFNVPMNHVFKRNNKLVCESILVQNLARIVNVIQGLQKPSKLRTFVTKLPDITYLLSVLVISVYLKQRI